MTQADTQTEQVIIDEIRKAYPHHSILSEESGFQEQRDNDYCWIIDPIDGTRNFMHGIPLYSISIALKHKNNLEVAVVYTPMLNELFCAARGEGALLNDRKIRVSNSITTNLGYVSMDPNIASQPVMQQQLNNDMIDALFLQSAALSLCYLASGRLNGVISNKIHAWDIAAGALIVKEAGGLTTDFYNTSDYLKSNSIIAASPRQHKKLYEIINKDFNKE